MLWEIKSKTTVPKDIDLEPHLQYFKKILSGKKNHREVKKMIINLNVSLTLLLKQKMLE